MGKRKFRLSVHRKNEERKKKAMKTLQVEHPPQPDVTPPPVKEQDCLPVSIPLHFFTESCVSSLSNLHCRVSLMMTSPSFTSSHPTWKIVYTEPLTLCKLEVQQASCEAEAMCGCVVMSLSISTELKWTLHYLNHPLSVESPLLNSLPNTVNSVAVVMKLIETLDSAKVCIGNSDVKFLEYWEHRASTLHGITSKY